jgi:2-polyprenyl-3-methyl-5-hydroxy-6-metoxy-1,4-benzoquinol methylase
MKDAMRAPWIAANFGAIAKTILVPEAEGFVARLALEPDIRVLDIACGTGNVTLPLARREAAVTGLDMTPHLLEEARARAASEGLNIRFDEGFAEALPCPDASFDMVDSAQQSGSEIRCIQECTPRFEPIILRSSWRKPA